MACTTVAKQTHALPSRPNLDGDGSAAIAPADQSNVHAISNSTLKPEDNVGAPVNGSGFLGAPTPLNNGVLESSEPAAVAPAAVAATPATPSAPVTAPGSIQGSVAPAATAAAAATVAAPAASTSGEFVVQVGAVSDQARAQQSAAPEPAVRRSRTCDAKRRHGGSNWGPFASKSSVDGTTAPAKRSAAAIIYYSRQLNATPRHPVLLHMQKNH